MYVPRPNAMDDDDVRGFVKDVGAAEVITVDASGQPQSTFLPIVWDGDRVIAHFARANPHWEQIRNGAPVLLVVRGAHAYVSPSWYATKLEHGKVVPTWNYSSVHLRGTAEVFHDPARLEHAVTLLTETHESEREDAWAVTDAPSDFIASMLTGIVGVEIHVQSVEAKAKLSQNRPVADRMGVISGLEAENNARGEHLVAEAMQRSLPDEG